MSTTLSTRLLGTSFKNKKLCASHIPVMTFFTNFLPDFFCAGQQQERVIVAQSSAIETQGPLRALALYFKHFYSPHHTQDHRETQA